MQLEMRDEANRRRKGRKLVAVLQHFLGSSLHGMTALDLGSSTGFISDELHVAGARVVGVDIDRPGLLTSVDRAGSRISFVCARGDNLPFQDESLDIVVLNHVYEHVVDPVAVMNEVRRVLRIGGVVYLGLGNRLGIIEPHYRLPFLSYLSPTLADWYLQLTHRGDRYHERLRSRPALRRLAGGLTVWDYTICVLAEPARFEADDMVRGWRASVPVSAYRLAIPLIPTYLWVGVKGDRRPAGPVLAVAPSEVSTPAEPS